MALRRIVLEGDEILRKTSKEVRDFGGRTHLLLDDMWETLKECDGIGLAAPQVGVLRRIVVVDIPPEPDAEDTATDADPEAEGAAGAARRDDANLCGRYELLNPVIVETEGEVREDEGCLSLPGLIGCVPRPARVKVRAFDRDGAEIIVEGEGILAKAFCHEIDHLNGILFTDIAESVREAGS
ncbi:MAG: peptide deformylase [Clostridiales Family XIII bacterium]|jgi:peptide deformylase|nr:peptide deformylase [Clostridiales Family XIII bacterium]